MWWGSLDFLRCRVVYLWVTWSNVLFDLMGLEVLLFIFQGFGSWDCFLSLPIWLEGLNFVEKLS